MTSIVLETGMCKIMVRIASDLGRLTRINEDFAEI